MPLIQRTQGLSPYCQSAKNHKDPGTIYSCMKSTRSCNPYHSSCHKQCLSSIESSVQLTHIRLNLLPDPAWGQETSTFVPWGPGGKSKAGLTLKKSAGFKEKPTISTGMTGQSSGRGMCVTPKECQTTTSSWAMLRSCTRLKLISDFTKVWPYFGVYARQRFTGA